ncbi:hypothetical protein DXG03_009103 [Asterophora parasitica]|uniref:Uncharacterized protein n=1 Tax=Asterophora parasitica TaxID=117018 RepID=A0A9P7K8R2_9AGAR|nr:hypothetical protein DXG03_009103 [Asterophora parasitica]
MTTNVNALEDGDLYVILFLNAAVGDCHWGLYHHYKNEWVPSTTPGSPKGRWVPKGHKYHVKNIGTSQNWMADHATTSGVLSSMFLVGLLRIGNVPPTYQQGLDTIMRSLDNSLSHHTGEMTYCRTWTMGILSKLVAGGYVRTRYSGPQVFSHIEAFGQQQWAGAANADQPRPIAASPLFE